jgi:hypothetical protein
VGVAGGVGTSTVAAALGGRDLGVFTGRPAHIVVCRATVASVLLAGRVTALCTRPVVAVTAVDAGMPSGALRSRLALLEPHTAAVVALPWVPHWRDLADPLHELRDQLNQPPAELPRAVGGYLAALAAIHTGLSSSPGLRSPARVLRSRRIRGPLFLRGLGAFADQIIGWMKWGVLVAAVWGVKPEQDGVTPLQLGEAAGVR